LSSILFLLAVGNAYSICPRLLGNVVYAAQPREFRSGEGKQRADGSLLDGESLGVYGRE